MNLSEDTARVIEAIQEYSDSGLRKKNDFGAILEITAAYEGGFETFNSLMFIGKQLWNVSNAMKKAAPSQEGLDLLQKEFAILLENFKDKMNVIYPFLTSEMQSRWVVIYFEMTKGCVLNLVDLAHDFSKMKDFQRKIKEG